MSKILKTIYDHIFFTLDYRKVRNVIPVELFPEVEGSLMGGGRCFIPFPSTED